MEAKAHAQASNAACKAQSTCQHASSTSRRGAPRRMPAEAHAQASSAARELNLTQGCRVQAPALAQALRAACKLKYRRSVQALAHAGVPRGTCKLPARGQAPGAAAARAQAHCTGSPRASQAEAARAPRRWKAAQLNCGLKGTRGGGEAPVGRSKAPPRPGTPPQPP